MAGAPSWLKGSVPGATPVSNPRGVLFMCTGNICRSAFADMYLRERLSARGVDDLPVSSAGIQAVVGHDLDSDMAVQARAHGLAGTGHVARQATGRMLRDAQLVVVFGPEHLSWIAQEFPEHLLRTVSLGRTADVLSASALTPGATRIPLGEVAPLVHGSPSDEGGWISDPYRRGPEVARAVADVIARSVDVLLDTIAWPL